MKLIDKDKVMSILSNKIANIKLDMKCGFLNKRKGTEKILILKHIISCIDILEVKEINIDVVSPECDRGIKTAWNGNNIVSIKEQKEK